MAKYKFAPDESEMPEAERWRIRATPDARLKIPDWLSEYAERHPDVDFGRFSIARWTCICEYVKKRFDAALHEDDGDFLKDPDVAEALWMIADEPMEIAELFESEVKMERYGGDAAADKARIESEYRNFVDPVSPYSAYGQWFNEQFRRYGIYIARWIVYTDALDSSPFVADLKRRIAGLDMVSGEPLFPDPFDDEDRPEEIPAYLLEQFGFGGVKCAGTAFKELILLARQVCGYGREPGNYPQFKRRVKDVGKWASKWVSAYDPKNRQITFLGVELDFSNAPKRWETVAAVVESRAEQGEVMLGHTWRGAWQTMRKDEFNLSRYIRPLDRRLKRGGWYHLTEKPMPDTPGSSR